MFSATPVTPPNGSVRFNRSTKIFEEWNGTAWVALILAIAGGGTGAATAGGATSALGLGTMAFQNSNAVNISGGTLQIQWMTVSLIICPPTDLAADLGDATRRFNKTYVAGGLVIPVGADKYIVG